MPPRVRYRYSRIVTLCRNIALHLTGALCRQPGLWAARVSDSRAARP
jgi:hypothetical protein